MLWENDSTSQWFPLLRSSESCLEVRVSKSLVLSCRKGDLFKSSQSKWYLTFGMPTYLHVAWWNLLPFRKHLFGDSLHSQVHFVLLSGWCLGHVLLHEHWQVSLLKMKFRGHNGGGSTLQTHWQVFRSRCLFGPQAWAWLPRRHTHWQLSKSSSLSGPQTSDENMSANLRG